MLSISRYRGFGWSTMRAIRCMVIMQCTALNLASYTVQLSGSLYSAAVQQLPNLCHVAYLHAYMHACGIHDSRQCSALLQMQVSS